MTTYYMDDARCGAGRLLQQDASTAIDSGCDTDVTDYDNVASPYICIETQVWPYVVAGACHKDITASATALQFRQDGGSWENLGTDISAYACSGLVNDASYGTSNCGDPSAAECGSGYDGGVEVTDGAVTKGITKEYYTSIVWGLDLSNAVAGSTYEFRIYDNDNSNPIPFATGDAFPGSITNRGRLIHTGHR
jgi:hypothetical protein